MQGKIEAIQLLKILLGISIVILFILSIIYVVLVIRNKKKEQDEEEEKNPNYKNKTSSAKTSQTKTYSIENVKKFLDFEEIKDNMIIQKKGKKAVMIVQCKGVNYDLMNSMEKVAVEMGFVQFLNILTRPIQIYVQSRKVNLEASVENYKKRLKLAEASFNKARMNYNQAQKDIDITDEQFKDIKMEYVRAKNYYEYVKDIINNTEKMSLNKNILTKNYYIVIYYYPDNTEDLFNKDELLDMAFSELYTNAQSILRTLASCGVSGKILNSEELADLLYAAYNRDGSEVYGIDKAIRAGYDALYTTAPNVFNKKIEELDKVINKRALDLANDTIEKVKVKDKNRKELETKEKEMDELIEELAKTIIMENENYISKEIAEEAVEEIENQSKVKKTNRRRVKKGA